MTGAERAVDPAGNASHESGAASQVRSTLREKRSWLTPLGRTGYGAKGVVYLLVGGLALLASLGVGGSVGGSKNAIVSLSRQPFGPVLLGAIAVGLACYTLWRMVQAATGIGVRGSDGQRAGKRLAGFFSGLLYAGLALFAGSLAVGAGGSESEGGGADWTTTLMRQPFGRWLVGAVGLVVVGLGLRQFVRSWRADFLERYRTHEMSAAERRSAKRVGQVGLAARGVVFCIIGTFVIRAALRADPSETKGLGGALHTLMGQPYGPWLTGVVALGLMAYGVLCLSYARYRDFAGGAGERGS